jgi:hypothetical protein
MSVEMDVVCRFIVFHAGIDVYGSRKIVSAGTYDPCGRSYNYMLVLTE